MADLSSVVSFLALAGSGNGASFVLGFRGPGRLDGLSEVAAGVGFDDDDDGETNGSEGSVEDVGCPLVVVPEGGASTPTSSFFNSSPSVAGGFQSGHFLASSESSGTSTTSLHSRRKTRTSKSSSTPPDEPNNNEVRVQDLPDFLACVAVPLLYLH